MLNDSAQQLLLSHHKAGKSCTELPRRPKNHCHVATSHRPTHTHINLSYGTFGNKFDTTTKMKEHNHLTKKKKTIHQLLGELFKEIIYQLTIVDYETCEMDCLRATHRLS